MSNDYRNTKYCPILENIVENKAKVVEMIKQDHPKAKDMHEQIYKNDSPYKIEFMRIYNYKCAYCGVAISILPKEMFEIDHFIYMKSQIFSNSKAAAGYIENLVLACHSCNHQKSSFEIPMADREYLYPDTIGIQNTFSRNDQYYIMISDKYKNNETVRNFYEQLKLGGEIHRLDYLLMTMLGLQNEMVDNSEVYAKLGQAINMLRLKRNIMK